MQEGHFHIKIETSAAADGGHDPSPCYSFLFSLLWSQCSFSHILKSGQATLAKQHYQSIVSAGLGPQAAHCINE